MDWIDCILRSSRLSVLINGSPEGYFHCSRGVRRGDPLSPLLFGIAEDFLSRLLSRMVDFSQLLPISSPRGFSAPTHLLYADDVLIFCRGTVLNLKNIMSAFEVYGNISSQLVNWGKSSNYFGSSVSPFRIGRLQSLVGMQIGRLPFSYLGVPLFQGKPKKSVLQPITDKILSRFANWKGKALSLAGRVTLIKSVITGSFVHSFMIYQWPSSLLRLVNRKLRNFLWTGSCEETKLIRVACGRCCKPYSQGGLGLKDLGLLNDSLVKKLTWKFMTSESFSFSFLRERYLTQLRKSHVGFRVRFPDLYSRIDSVVISPVTDSLVWAHYGQVSCKSAYSCMIRDSPQVPWWRDVWCRFIHPSRSALTWHFLLNRLPTEDRLCRVGFHLDSRCSVCGVSSESSDHLFIRCPLAVTLWEEVFSAFQRRISSDTWSSFFSRAMSVIWSPPAPGWTKVNTDGAALSSPGAGGCGGIFRNCRAFVKGCFYVPLDHVFAFKTELLATSIAINFAWQNRWHRI
ncbi:hypothetical protein Ddye_003312 [Dipteronia dyeriana]|uniref:Reverse transcriptase domain-containing protein n=1 Tax=Dipteronia dyeriana TaxID=168575 RepID=A0AAE0CVV5_9ROSI|nr:hypothetical protein Ddye_003312 [Dipteronia dyeriana]